MKKKMNVSMGFLWTFIKQEYETLVAKIIILSKGIFEEERVFSGF